MINSSTFIKQFAWVFVWFVASFNSVSAAIFNVNSPLDDINANPEDGKCLTENAPCTLRAAVMEANKLDGADIINLPADTYVLNLETPNEDPAAVGDLDIYDSLEIIGANRNSTIISGGGIFRLISIFTTAGENTPIVTLKNLTLTEGRDDDPEKIAAIYNEGILTLENVTVTAAGNKAYAIHNNAGFLEIDSSAISNNYSGIRTSNGMVQILNSDFDNNVQTEYLDFGGTAIRSINQSRIEIINSNFQNNQSQSSGGAIFLHQSTLYLENSLLSDNTANQSSLENIGYGGGIFANESSILLVKAYIINNNAFVSGAGIYSQNGNLTVKDSEIRSNRIIDTENGTGGGITYFGVSSPDLNNSLLEIKQTSIQLNEATYGGGVAVQDSEKTGNLVEISNSSFYQNIAAKAGGALYYDDQGQVSITNTTILENSASNAGGGIYANITQAGSLDLLHASIVANNAPSGANIQNNLGLVESRNSIIANGSTGMDCEGEISSLGNNLDSDNSCSLSETLNDIPEADLLSGITSSYMWALNIPFRIHELSSNSPAKNAANQEHCLETGFVDQRYHYRADGMCDIGAYEYGSSRALSGEIEFSVAEMSIFEDQAFANVAIKRLNSNEGTVSISVYTQTSGSATADTDFEPIAQKIVWLDGDSDDKTIIIPIINDQEKESTETIQLSLTHVNGGASIGTQNTLAINIEDDESLSGVVTFAEEIYNASEADTEFLLPILRKNGNAGVATVTLLIEIYSELEDTTTSLSQVIEIPEGVTQYNYKAIPDFIQNDYFSGDFEFRFTLSNPENPIQLGNVQSTQINVFDDEPKAGLISFETETYSISETDINFSIPILRTNGSVGDATATLFIEIYRALDNTTVTSEHVITIPDGITQLDYNVLPETWDNNYFNDDIIIRFTLGNPRNPAQLGDLQSTQINISDDESKPANPGIISFEKAEYFVRENEGYIEINVNRTSGTDGNVNASIEALDENLDKQAKYAEDFSLSGETSNLSKLEFSTGMTNGKIRIEITNDVLVEGQEDFNIELFSPLGTVELGEITKATIHIIDDETSAELIQFSQSAYTVDESDQFLRVTLERINAGTSEATVQLKNDLVSENEGDAVRHAPKTIKFEEGVYEKDIIIDLAYENDDQYDGDETFTLSLSNKIGRLGLGENASVTVTIEDNDPKPDDADIISFVNSGIEISENIGYVDIELQRLNPSIDIVETTIIFSDIDTDSNDYRYSSNNAFTAQNLQFGSNEESITFRLDIPNDAIIEPNETFLIQLFNIVNGKPGEVTVARVTILDYDKPATISFEQTEYSFPESAGKIQIPLTKTKGVQSSFDVTISSIESTAKLNEDYTEFTNTSVNSENLHQIKITNDNNSYALELELIDNDTFDRDKSFSISLSDPTNEAEIGEFSEILINIVDDESKEDAEPNQINEKNSIDGATTTNEIQKGAGAIHPFGLVSILLFALTRLYLFRRKRWA